MSYRLTSTAHFLTFDVRGVAPVHPLLEVLTTSRARATFFVPRGLAAESPSIIRAIARSGHEIAASGSEPASDWQRFRDEARDTKAMLEELAGTQVRGFRASTGALGSHASWGFEVLAEEGYEYDSSCVAAERPTPRAAIVPDYPYAVMCAAGSMIELPVSRLDVFGRALATRTRAGLPTVVALPLENPDAPASGRAARLAAMWPYNGKRATPDRVARLVRDFRFEAIGHRLHELSFGTPTTFAA